MSAIYIVAAKRTPFGVFGGKLKDFTATELGAFAGQAALKQLPQNLAVDSVIFGNVLQSSACAAYLARHIGHRCKLPVTVPALTINRLCGSGFQSMVLGVQEIKLGESHVVLTGGTENMSMAPYAARGIRFGVKLGTDPKLEDTLAAALVDRFPQETPMSQTAENLADKYNLSREDCDAYALESQKRWKSAQDAGVFKDEIVSVTVRARKGPEQVDVDEHPRPQTTIEILAKLKPLKKEGVVTAGNASGINDGAGAVVVASEEAVKKYGLKPLARVVSYHVAGVDPSIMGIGPVPAIKGALKNAGLTLQDMGIVEVNEAFAAQYLSCEKELGLDRSITNACGGAIAVGHPLGASGSRILANLCYRLKKGTAQYAIGSACIGGGQGIAVVLEKC